MATLRQHGLKLKIELTGWEGDWIGYLAEKTRLGGKHPDDQVCLIVRFDAHWFTRNSAYSRSGPALIMNPRRREVERFVQELRLEYAALPPHPPENVEADENGD